MELVSLFNAVKLVQDPISADEGSLYFNTASNVYRYHTSGSWRNLLSDKSLESLNVKNVYNFGSDTTASISVTLSNNYINSILSINAIDRAEVFIPSDSESSIPVGSSIKILKSGPADTHIRERPGVTLNIPSSIYLNAQWSSGTLYKIDSNSWIFETEYPDIY